MGSATKKLTVGGALMFPVMALGAAVTAGPKIYQAFAAGEQGKLAKKAAERNALIATQAGELAEASGAVEAARMRSKTVLNIAKARASMLAQGIDPASAGLKDLVTGMAETGETDAQIIRNNAARQAWGYRNQAATALYEGDAAAARANQEQVASILGAVSDTANAAASIFTLKPAGAPAADGLGVK
jgi:hypothetical protein